MWKGCGSDVLRAAALEEVLHALRASAAWIWNALKGDGGLEG